MTFGRTLRSLTTRTTALLVAFVAVSIVVMAGLGYSKLNEVTEENAVIRIDRAARAAAALTVATVPDRFEVVRDSEGRPQLLRILSHSTQSVLEWQPIYDALLKEIATVNQGAANFFRFNPNTRAFDRFVTTFRGPNGSIPAGLSFGPAHPAYGALVARAVHVGQVPVNGRLRLAYFLPILDHAGDLAGALAVDVGFVDDLVTARNELREETLFWSIVILLLVASAGAGLAYRQMKPLRAVARFAHDLASGVEGAEVPSRGRPDEIGDLAEGLSQVVELQSNLERLAYGDQLTGLANRVRYFADLDQALRRCQRDGTTTALIMLDLDRFKETNDAFGQSAGDDLLVQARDIILAELDEGDRLARLGGDDFVILSDDVGSEARVEQLCQRLIARLAKPIMLPQGEVHTGCSLGVALLPRDGTTAEEAHRNADLALRKAKNEGRGRYCIYTDGMNDQNQKRMTLARLLRQALENNELTVHVQPQVRLRDGRISGFEALARWPHPTGGMIPPGEFIPVAEANGLIPAVGARILEEACRIAREWNDAGFEFGHIAVNVSSIQLGQPNFVALVTETLRRYALPPHQLCLEVTESVFLNHKAETVTAMFRDLRAAGVMLSLDDFGAGYSSLNYLNGLPLDQLKIDRAFVANVDRDPRKRSLLTGILALGKGLRLQLIAEGAETAEEVEVLRELGCAVVQGYYFSKPVPYLMAPVEAERIREMPRRGGNASAKEAAA